MAEFHGSRRARAYFEGWYFKQQNEEEVLALIPAYHTDAKGNPSASLQVISQAGSFQVEYPAPAFHAERRRFRVQLGENLFTDSGCKLSCKEGGNQVTGELRYQKMVPPAYDIMGPFCCVPKMECRHSVLSMRHQVEGEVRVNGKVFRFQDGLGYLEGDRGVSFPKRYIWTQCNDGANSVMLSVAEIPFLGSVFVGCIGFVLLDGRERRLATYLGAKPILITPEQVVVRQRGLTLTVQLLEKHHQPLHAPVKGGMTRVIHESAASTVRYRLEDRQGVLFERDCRQASYENAWEL